MGGLRGGSNLASWVVAGTLAYFLWVKPAQELKREQEARTALAVASDRYRYVEKVKELEAITNIISRFLLPHGARTITNMPLPLIKLLMTIPIGFDFKGSRFIEALHDAFHPLK
ncbi:unnamed protein product [Lactuca virosa]|uniref:Uncharacterized protein n=1 Tax=Lactuca virosa TaxID=75947 RepID=A0AAU9NEG2_9ASTR|nr:unnamed protein product [Lactuca virosa]